MKISLFLTPEPFRKADISEKTIVVIDVLRATTTICAALNAGARAVIPASERGKAGDIRVKIGSENSILAGERDGVKIESFDLGNSPLEFTRETVEGKFIILCTTNGTPVLEHATKGKKVYCAALVNISSIAGEVFRQNSDLIIVCSGKEGEFSTEDTLCAGKLIDILQTEHKIKTRLNDAGSLALLLYKNNSANLARAVADGEHGRYLSSIGFDSDIEFASRVDTIEIIPTLVDGQLVAKNNNK